MEPWMLAAILAAVIVVVGALVILLRRGGWKVSEISVWPPGAKLQPGNKPAAPGDHVSVTEESKVGNVTIDGAAPNVTIEVRKRSEAGDIDIKR